MGHDITGHNINGKEIAYAQFSMGNYNATILYSLLDADKYNAGVSGSGDTTTFSVQQMDKALDVFKKLCNNGDSTLLKNESLSWDEKQILNFLLNCSATAQEEGNVTVCFG
ncbi:hypothetical protein [Aquibacillus albus]|uniref:GTPase n=1 Tax=Aquibacillus albus TaxID=1168171 RepID=A0ABS2N646_9BACI|nr:hypothetical protein [Aquibacillus albus]MBM7573610.1 GTPase [Aquibacillus albus]